MTSPEADAHDVDVVLPTRDDPMLRDGAAGVDGLEGLGGPVGRRALLLASWWTPVRVTLLVLFGSLVAGYLLKAPCRDASVWVDEYQFTHLCYTDTLASFTAYGLDAGQWPYVGFATPYRLVETNGLLTSDPSGLDLLGQLAEVGLHVVYPSG